MAVRLPSFSAPVERWAAELGRTLEIALGRLEQTSQRRGARLDLAAVAKAELPPPERDGSVLFVTDATGGAVPAYSRGGAWLRFDTNAPVT